MEDYAFIKIDVRVFAAENLIANLSGNLQK